MNKLKICVFTGTRAEYGLLYWLIKGLSEDPCVDMQLVVGGMHLSPEFGLTYREIEKDGFTIAEKLETLLSSDTATGISKSIGLGIISAAECFERLKPDVLIVLGDRYEVFAVATAAMISRIVIAHCHGGEATEGLIDEPIRHSITKMSHLHFTSTEKYRHRVIQLGEQPDRVFNVGALGIENINRLTLLGRQEFETSISSKLKSINILVTFHPVTLESSSAEGQFKELLKALYEIEDSLIIFTKANSDTDGRIINQLIDQYVFSHPDTSVAFPSLGQLRYLSALQYIDFVIGNSSSGLIEVPSFKKPTINIGDRQRGREIGETVINCDPQYESIKDAIRIALSKDFNNAIQHSKNLYGTANASDKIIQILKSSRYDEIIKKKFFDLT